MTQVQLERWLIVRRVMGMVGEGYVQYRRVTPQLREEMRRALADALRELVAKGVLFPPEECNLSAALSSITMVANGAEVSFNITALLKHLDIPAAEAR